MKLSESLETILYVLWTAIQNVNDPNNSIVKDETVIAIAKNLDVNVHYSYHEDNEGFTYYYEFSDGSEYTY